MVNLVGAMTEVISLETIDKAHQLLAAHPGLTEQSGEAPYLCQEIRRPESRDNPGQVLDNTLTVETVTHPDQGHVLATRQCGRTACQAYWAMIFDNKGRMTNSAGPFQARCAQA